MAIAPLELGELDGARMAPPALLDPDGGDVAWSPRRGAPAGGRRTAGPPGAAARGPRLRGGPRGEPRRRPLPPQPAQRDLARGWNVLLGEIGESARRLRVVKGSEATSAHAAGDSSRALPAGLEEGGRALSQDTEALLQRSTRSGAPTNPETALWRSYSIDERIVPDSTIEDMWRRASEPACRDLEIAPLDRVPRLTVTNHEVQPLPAVHGLEHWRADRRARREGRTERHNAEEQPSLGEMMRTIFGCDAPPKAQTRAFAAERLGPLAETPGPPEEEPAAPAGGRGSPRARAAAPGEEELQEEVRRQWLKEAHADADAVAREYGVPFIGVRNKGRRPAFDAGQPSAPGHGLVAQHLQPERVRARRSRLLRRLEAAREAQGPRRAELLHEACAASVEVDMRCKRRIRRMHHLFVRKQLQMSVQLERRVKRLQLDYEDVQSSKVTSILPSSLAAGARPCGPGGAASQQSKSVLHYLQRHRRLTEGGRRRQDEVYLSQVERFQLFLRLVADPNRAPDRGEVYLSECFRHVLAAGFIIDDAFFFRVLGHLEREDFERTPTVNLLAACCEAFDVDLQQYFQLLEEKGAPLLAPAANAEGAERWEEWAPWDGVKLRPVMADGGSFAAPLELGAASDGSDDPPDLPDDPLPFRPIVRQETPASSSVSRADPLSQIIAAVAMDSVLERYVSTRPRGLGNGGGQRHEPEEPAAPDGAPSEPAGAGAPRGAGASGRPAPGGAADSPALLPAEPSEAVLPPLPAARPGVPPLALPRPETWTPRSARLRSARRALDAAVGSAGPLAPRPRTPGGFGARRVAALAAEAALASNLGPGRLPEGPM